MRTISPQETSAPGNLRGASHTGDLSGMILIQHRSTGAVIQEVASATLAGANLSGLHLAGASLNGADLRGANLRGAYLAGASLEGAHLDGADLQGAELGDVAMVGASLVHASLSDASLTGANLQSADLSEAELVGASLRGAYLRGANLTRASLIRANLTGTTLDYAVFSSTRLTDCPTLYLSLGLELSTHHGPSNVDRATLSAGAPYLPDAFLFGIGMRAEEINRLRNEPPTTVRSDCLISFSQADAPFSDRLREALRAHSVNCSQFSYDLPAAIVSPEQMLEAVRLNDKVILVCSRRGLERRTFSSEIHQAIQREVRARNQKLFPLRLDGFILSASAVGLGARKTAAKEWQENWVEYLQTREVLDFSNWRDPRAYEQGVRTLAGLLQSPPRL